MQRNDLSVGSDDELVAAALRGDPSAFGALVGRSRPRVVAVVARMLGNDEAEDVAQEALLHAYLGLTRLRDPDRFTSWVCGIAVNLAKMRLRRRAAQPITVGGTPEPAAPVEERELLELARDAVAVLSPGQRDVVLMHYIDGLSCAEIAELLDSSPGAVRVRLHRARAQLRVELAPLAHAPPTAKKEEIPMVEMQVEDVMVRVATDDPSQLVWDGRIVLLKEKERGRLLPIWIGSAEGNALALSVTGEPTPRPTSSDLAVELLRVTGGRIEHVTITRLHEATFHATVAVTVDGQAEELDARPSDAINLAVRVGATIQAADAVVNEAAFESDDLQAQLDREGEEAGAELPPGEWASLSAELLRILHKPPKRLLKPQER